MPRKKYHRDRVFQVIGEPGPGSTVVGYVRYSSELQNETSITTQKRIVKDFVEKKGWHIVKWYEEPEESAKYDSIDERPVFAQLLKDAAAGRFQVITCAFSNRWARSMEAGYASLSRLRRAQIWWCTADGLWDIDKIQQDGFDVAFAVDMQMNASYVRQLSKRTIAGKEDRAREGYHNGNVPFGYLDPEYQKAPDGAPSTWRPPRAIARIDPINFPALVRIGELVAQGWTDQSIADEMERGGYISSTARFGERLLTKDTIAAIRRSWFPREFAPGSGFGTIETPSGELVVGKHVAAWPYELWQKMVEVKASQYRRPTKNAQKRPHEFSRIIACAACQRSLRVSYGSNGLPYYRDSSRERKLPCPIGGAFSVRSTLVMMQFGEILRSIELPDTWRDALRERCQELNKSNDSQIEHIRKRREEIEKEQQQLIKLFRKSHIDEQTFDAEMDALRIELFKLPIPDIKDTEQTAYEAITAGENLLGMIDYWQEATPEERRDIVWALFDRDCLLYDLERFVIVAIRPRTGLLPVLALGLEATSMWEQREEMLWLREEYWPPKQNRQDAKLHSALTPAQQERAIMLIRQGMPLRKIAELFSTTYDTIRRLAKNHNLPLPGRESKLTFEQKQEAYQLLEADHPLREVAQRFHIHHESLRRMAQHDGILLRPKGEKLTPTERKLTQAQQQSARELVDSGVSFRQVAKQFGISRTALHRVLEDSKDKQPQERELTPDQQHQARELVEAGTSLRQTAKQFGINHHTLIGYLKKEDLHYEEK